MLDNEMLRQAQNGEWINGTPAEPEPAVSEAGTRKQRFTEAEAEDVLIPDLTKGPAEITIGNRVIPVLGMNIPTLKAVISSVASIMGPLRRGSKNYQDELLAHNMRVAEGESSTAPDGNWWLPVILESVDSVLVAVLAILKRGDPTLTMAFLEEHFEPLKHLQELYPLVSETNNLGVLIKKAVKSDLAKMVMTMVSQARSDSQPSAERSVGTTESPSTTSPE